VSELLIIVPARGGSKRLPGKNIRRLAGKTLLEYTAQAIEDAGLGDNLCLLSTDEGAIADHGRALGWTVPWLRPAAISGDEAATVDAVLHAVNWVEEAHTLDPDTVMVLQPTSPLRGADCLKRALDLLQERSDAQAVVGMRELEMPGDRLYSANVDGYIESLPAPGNLVPNGAVYLARTQAVRAHRTLYPPRTLPLVMGDAASIDIDTASDWSLAETLLASPNLTDSLAVARS